MSEHIKVKLKHALRIDRALCFVWKAAPWWSAASGIVIIIQGVLPLISLYLMKLIIDAVSQITAINKAGTSDGLQTFFHSAFSFFSLSDLFFPGEELHPFSMVVFYIALAFGAGLVTAAASYASSYFKKAQALAVTDHMFSVLHEKSVSVDLAYYENPEYQDTLHRAQIEGPYRPTLIVNGLILIGQNAASLAAVFWLLIMFNPLLPLVMGIAVVPGLLMRLNYSGGIYAWQQSKTEDERKAFYFNKILTETDHAREMRLFGLGEHFMERFRKIKNQLRFEKLALEKKRGAGDLVAQSSGAFAVFGASVYIAVKTIQGAITMGDMVMYFQAFQRGLAYLKSLLEGVAGLYEDNLFLSNFYEFLDIEPKIKDPVEPEPVPEVIQKGFSIKGITFTYQNCEKKVINRVNFFIPPGKVVALVGENGSGKSTLVKLLCRLYDPDQGCIMIDDIDIRNFTTRDYRKKISAVFQDYIRYYLTAHENISLSDVDCEGDLERVGRAAYKAGIAEYISSLDAGFNTHLGRAFTDGEELSVGQWQMMALARAFFREAELIILDEPTSALDVNTEYAVFRKFKELIQNKSALIISHRFSTVKMADTILLLEHGEITEYGSHDDLMRHNGRYAALFRKQAEHYNY